MNIADQIMRRADRAFAEASGRTLIEDLSPEEQKAALEGDIEQKARYVRTPAGVRRFKRPIGAIILPRGGSLDQIRIKDPVFKGFDLVEDRKGNLYDVGKDDSTGKYVALKHNTWDDQIEPQDSLDKALGALNEKLGGGTNSDAEKPAKKASGPKKEPDQTPVSDQEMKRIERQKAMDRYRKDPFGDRTVPKHPNRLKTPSERQWAQIDDLSDEEFEDFLDLHYTNGDSFSAIMKDVKKWREREAGKESSSDSKPQGDAPASDDNVASSDPRKRSAKFKRAADNMDRALDAVDSAKTEDDYRRALVDLEKSTVEMEDYIKSKGSEEDFARSALPKIERAKAKARSQVKRMEAKRKDAAAKESAKPKTTSKGAPGSKERDAFIESHPKIKDVLDYDKPKLRDMSEKNFEAYVAAVEGGKSPNSIGAIMDRVAPGASWNPITEKWSGQDGKNRSTSPTPTGDTSASDAADAAVRDRVEKMKASDRSKGRTNPYTSSLKPHQKDEVDALTPGEYATYMNARDDGHGHQGAVHRAKNQPKVTYFGALRDADDAITNAKKNLSPRQTPEEQEYELKNRQKRLQEANAELGRHRAALPQKLDQMTSEQKAQEKEILAKYQAIDDAENAILRKRRAVMKKREDQAGQQADDAARNQKNREARESAEQDSRFGNTATFVSANQNLIKKIVSLGRSGKDPYPHISEARARLAEIDKRLSWTDDQLGGYHKGKGKAESDERAAQFRSTLQSQRANYEKAINLMEDLKAKRSKPKGGDKPSSSGAQMSKQYGDAPLAADGLPVQTSKSSGSRATGDYIPALPKGKQKTYVITSPDGRTHLDNTSRAATHAVVVRESDGSWSLHSVNGSEAAARKAALTYSNRNGVGSAQVVPSTPREAAQPSQSTSSDAPKSPAYERGARLMDTSHVRQRSDGKWNVMPGALPSDLTNLSDEDLRFLEGGGMTDDYKQTFVLGIDDSNRLSAERRRRGRAAMEARESEERATQAAEIQRQNGNVTWNPDLTPAQKGRLDKHLAREYRYEDGIHTTREEYGKTTGKRITAGEHFLVYEDGSSVKVPKIVYDAAQFPDAKGSSSGASEALKSEAGEYKTKARDLAKRIREALSDTTSQDEAYRDRLRALDAEYVALLPRNRQIQDAHFGSDKATQDELRGVANAAQEMGAERNRLATRLNGVSIALERQQSRRPQAKRPETTPSRPRETSSPAPAQERVKGADSTVSLAKTQAQKARRARTEKSARDHINTLNGTERDLNRTLERSGDRMPADQRAEVEQALQEIRAARAKAEENIPLRDRTHLRPSDLPALRDETHMFGTRGRQDPELTSAEDLHEALPSKSTGRYQEYDLDMDALDQMVTDGTAPSVPELNRAIRAMEAENRKPDGDDYDESLKDLKRARDYIKDRLDRERAEFEAANTSLFGDDLSIPEPAPARPKTAVERAQDALNAYDERARNAPRPDRGMESMRFHQSQRQLNKRADRDLNEALRQVRERNKLEGDVQRAKVQERRDATPKTPVSPEIIKGADAVLVYNKNTQGADWHRVKRVNKTTVTVDGGGGGMDDFRFSHDRVVGVRKNGETILGSTDKPSNEPKDGPYRRGADRIRRAGLTGFTPNQARQVDEMTRDQWEEAQAALSNGESFSDVLGRTAVRNRRDPMAPPPVSRDEVQRRLAERRAAREAASRPDGSTTQAAWGTSTRTSLPQGDGQESDDPIQRAVERGEISTREAARRRRASNETSIAPPGATQADAPASAPSGRTLDTVAVRASTAKVADFSRANRRASTFEERERALRGAPQALQELDAHLETLTEASASPRLSAAQREQVLRMHSDAMSARRTLSGLLDSYQSERNRVQHAQGQRIGATDREMAEANSLIADIRSAQTYQEAISKMRDLRRLETSLKNTVESDSVRQSHEQIAEARSVLGSIDSVRRASNRRFADDIARAQGQAPAGQSEDRTSKTPINIGNFGVRSESEARRMYANTPRRDIADIPKGGNGHIGNGIWVKRCPVCGQAFKSVGAPGYSATYARHVDGHNTGAAIPGYNTGMLS